MTTSVIRIKETVTTPTATIDTADLAAHLATGFVEEVVE